MIFFSCFTFYFYFDFEIKTFFSCFDLNEKRLKLTSFKISHSSCNIIFIYSQSSIVNVAPSVVVLPIIFFSDFNLLSKDPWVFI